MKLSVIILNYNVRYFLELCLRSVEAALKDVDAEIIVVDNKSTDESCSMLKRFFPRVRLIENDENLGFSMGNNRGVEEARGHYLCILNPDTLVAEDTFSKLVAFADTIENLGIIGCQLIDGTGQFLPESKRNVPKPMVALKKLIGYDRSYYANHLQVNSIGKADIFVGAFMFLKTSVYKAVGGFDENFFMYGEDIDLSFRVLNKGLKNIYYGEITAVHFKGESTFRDEEYIKRFYGAMDLFYDKHFKTNPLFKKVVALGINLASKKSYIPKSINKAIDNTYVISKAIPESLKKPLQKPVILLDAIPERIDDQSMLIYDLESISSKAIIADMKRKSGQMNIVFRFLMKNSKFIIGSDSAVQRGEVTQF